jgi:hypothetical protein
MSVYAGPEILNDGLVFSFDIGNFKSWKGAPTTNINSGQELGGMQTITLTYVGLEKEWKKYSISGTWNAGTYPFSMYISGATFTGGVAYSAQCLMKTNVRNKFATFGFIYYVNDPNMTNGGTSTSTSIGYEDGLEIISNKVEGFIYSTGYANPTTSQVGYLGTRPLSDGTTFNSGTDFVWIKDVQVEQGAFCTPYTPTARSNTQSILDLTNNHTININDLTYFSNNTFSFDGANDNLSLSSTTNVDFISNFSIVCIFKQISASNPGPLIEKYNWAIANKGGWALRFNGGNLAFFGSNVTTTSQVTVTSFLQTNTTYHVVAVCEGGPVTPTMRLYINGVLNNSATLTNNIATTIGMPIYIGQRGDNSGAFNNTNIYHAAMYNRVLSASEVLQNFNALRGRFGI